jgi:hypothetical protein
MKTVQHIRRHSRFRRLAIARPIRVEVNRTSLREVLDNPVRAKLRVGSSDDYQEREADAVADRVVDRTDAPVQRKAAEVPVEEDDQKGIEVSREQEEVQRKVAGTGEATSANALPVGQVGGRPLPGGERSFFEPRLNSDLSRVRIHTDAEAERLAEGFAARAFTVGSDVYFGAGEYRPGSREGRRLLAHELTHVLQQRNGNHALQRKIDRISTKQNGIDLYFSLGLYGSKATDSLARRWATNIESNWNQQLKVKDRTIDAKIHVTAKAYPHLADIPMLQMAISESNAVFVEKNGFRSYVEYSGWGHDHWSTGRWAADAQPLVVAHEAGHMMGLDDKYVDLPFLGSVDLPGYEKDIMANFWNDNGKTDFSRGWCGLLLYYYFGYRS